MRYRRIFTIYFQLWYLTNNKPIQEKMIIKKKNGVGNHYYSKIMKGRKTISFLKYFL